MLTGSKIRTVSRLTLWILIVVLSNCAVFCPIIPCSIPMNLRAGSEIIQKGCWSVLWPVGAHCKMMGRTVNGRLWIGEDLPISSTSALIEAQNRLLFLEMMSIPNCIVSVWQNPWEPERLPDERRKSSWGGPAFPKTAWRCISTGFSFLSGRMSVQ